MLATDQGAIRAELDKILASRVFANAPRMTRFLRFVVETALAGNAATIKEYVIAIEVFGKPEDYDPQADSTVRTEASKLRSRLERYYSTEGRDDIVAICIPKGTYVPVFEERVPAVPTASAPPQTVASAVDLSEEQPGTISLPTASRSLPVLKLSAGLVAVGIIAGCVMLWWSRAPASPSPRLVPLTTYPELEEQPSLS